MTLGNLLEFYNNGALSIKYNKGDCVANIGGVAITEEQASVICSRCGWTNIYLHPFEIIEKTAKFIKAFKTNSLSDEEVRMLYDITVEFQNNRSNTYGRTFDRIHAEHRNFNLSILYGMAGNESPYVVYDSLTSTPVKKCRNMKQVVAYIQSRLQ